MAFLVKPGNVRSDINVTPLVDVVLVLLIIFMVVTPMLQKGKAVKLPSTTSPDKQPEDSKQILVVIDEKKTFMIEAGHEKSAPMTEEQFESKLQETFQRNPGSTIVVKADARLTYGDVKKAMLTIRDAGFQSVGLITEKRLQTARS